MDTLRTDFGTAESPIPKTPVFTSDQDVTTTANVVFVIKSNYFFLMF